MKNKKRILIVSGSILVIVFTAIVLYFLVAKKDPNPAFTPDLDPNAVVQTEPIAEKPAGQPAEKPEGNPCYFTFEIVLTDEEETIYTSKMVEPGKAITDVTLSRALEKGEYPAIIKIKTTSLEDGMAMNGANVETILVVQ